MQTFQGAVRDKTINPDYRELWRLTNDTKLLSEADTEDIIWVDNQEALKIELGTRFPQPHPSLKIIHDTAHGISVEVLKYPRYEGANGAEIHAFAKEFGRIEVQDRQSYSTKKEWEEYTPIAKECRVWGQYYQKWVEYNPALVKKKYKAKLERMAKAYVTCREIQDVANKAVRQVWNQIELKGCSAACDLGRAVSMMTQRLAIFNMLYGKQAHRKWEPFQKLCLQWKARSKNNGDRFKGTPALVKFEEWMDKEVKKRLPPVCTAWTVLELTVPI